MKHAARFASKRDYQKCKANIKKYAHKFTGTNTN
jgi:hypothetical protein